MGLWFVFNILVFFSAGAWTLYAHYRAFGLPTVPAQALQSSLFLGFFLIATTTGLLTRRTWARASAVAICIWTAFAPGAIYLGPMLPKGQIFAANLNIFRPLALTLPDMRIVTLVALFFALKSMGMYYSAAMDVSYGKARPAWWKTILATLILAFILCIDVLVPKELKPTAAKNAAPGAAKDPVAMEAARVKAEKDLAGRGVRACRISLDETRLLMVTGDGQGHIVDLRSGHLTSHGSKIETREWPSSFTDPSVNPIGPDADMYFDSDRSLISRFSDPSFRFSVGGGANQFVGFTSSPKQIIVYNRDSRALRRIEIPLGTVIWSVVTHQEVKPPAFTSPDFTAAAVRWGQDRLYLLSLRDGRLIDISPGIPKIENVQFGAKWLRIAGRVGEAFENPIVDFQSAIVRKESGLPRDELVTYDDERKVFVTRKGGAPALPQLPSPVLFAAVLNPNKYLVAAEEKQSQLTLIDLDTKMKSGVGRVHDLQFTSELSCFAVSSTRRIFAVALGDKVEIFWSAFLAADQFRSVVLTLPVK